MSQQQQKSDTYIIWLDSLFFNILPRQDMHAMKTNLPIFPTIPNNSPQFPTIPHIHENIIQSSNRSNLIWYSLSGLLVNSQIVALWDTLDFNVS